MIKFYLPIFTGAILLVIVGCQTEPEFKLTDEYLIRNWRVETVLPKEVDDYYRKNSPFPETSRSLTASDNWKEFIKNYKEGDELWYFVSGPGTWENLLGRAGFAIFRNDELIAHITTFEN